VSLSRALGIPVRVDKDNNVIFAEERKDQDKNEYLLQMLSPKNNSGLTEKVKRGLQRKLSLDSLAAKELASQRLHKPAE